MRSENGPVAVHTRLGWVISGPVDVRAREPNTASVVTHILKVDSEMETRRLDKQLRKFWELESLGINDTEESVHDQYRDIVAFKNGRYEMSLLWKDPSIVLPDNFELGMRRLKNLWKRLKQNPELLKAYDEVIREQLERGIFEVDEDPFEVNDARVHYLPHKSIQRSFVYSTMLQRMIRDHPLMIAIM